MMPKKGKCPQKKPLFVNNQLTTHQYNNIRKQVKKLGHSVFPSYRFVKAEKENCYPPEHAVTVTEVSAEINLQDLLDITIRRIVTLQNEVFKHCLFDLPGKSFTLLCKWGCDGSSAQSRYKQKLESLEHSDENLFAISFVPLRLIMTNNKIGDTSIIWQNRRASSTRYCRMIRFIYRKETTELIKAETQRIQEQINKLTPTLVSTNDMEFAICHKMMLTMVDGKICSALSQYTSSQLCYICGASPKEMNDEKRLKQKLPIQEMYSFGISPLHSWIRSFEFILHLSYKVEIKKWQARSPEEKSSVEKRKKNIQKQFREQMGLLVDMPKQSSGHTNDGNTARRFFKNTAQTAAITEIDENLIHHFKILMEALSSAFEINPDIFGEYARHIWGICNGNKRYLIRKVLMVLYASECS